MREEGVESGAVVFESAFLATYTEAHLAGLPGNTQFIEQRDEIRIGPIVVDDEAGVDRDLPARRLYIHGVRVPAGRSKRLLLLEPLAAAVADRRGYRL
jgi:hypothetical protein